MDETIFDDELTLLPLCTCSFVPYFFNVPRFTQSPKQHSSILGLRIVANDFFGRIPVYT